MPPSTGCATLFDLAQAGYQSSSYVALIWLGVLIAFACYWFRHQIARSSFVPHADKIVTFGCLFSFAVALVITIDTYSRYSALQDHYKRGLATVTTGTVEEFRPKVAGSTEETFVVAGRRFFYSEGTMMPGYRKYSKDAGPIKDGLEVRVTHVGNDIAKLESCAAGDT
jgi:hypothetical protein